MPILPAAGERHDAGHAEADFLPLLGQFDDDARCPMRPARAGKAEAHIADIGELDVPFRHVITDPGIKLAVGQCELDMLLRVFGKDETPPPSMPAPGL